MSNYSPLLKRASVRQPEHRRFYAVQGQTNFAKLRSAPASSARIRKIAVALDGSPIGELAIPYALRLAKITAAELQLMYVRRSYLSRPGPTYLPAIVERLKGANVRLRAPLCFEGINAAKRLCTAVDDTMDLVVTAKPRSLIGRLLSSSVCERLLKTTSTPLLIVSDSIPPSDFHWSPPMRRLLVPLMGHHAQPEVLQIVAEIGRLAEGSQTLLRILPIEIAATASDGQETPRHPATALSALREAEGDLNDAASCLPNPQSRLIYSTTALEKAVLFDAIANEFDLVALSTRTRGWLRRFLCPDVYDLLLRRTCLPLLVLRERSKPTR
jgi:nucleotide-binding universal stress UspA family protein